MDTEDDLAPEDPNRGRRGAKMAHRRIDLHDKRAKEVARSIKALREAQAGSLQFLTEEINQLQVAVAGLRSCASALNRDLTTLERSVRSIKSARTRSKKEPSDPAAPSTPAPVKAAKAAAPKPKPKPKG